MKSMAVLEAAVEKDGRFNPSRIPSSARSRALVEEARRQLLDHEAVVAPRLRERKKLDQGRFDRIVSAIICDLAHAALTSPDEWRHISLSKRMHGREAVGAPFMTAARIEIIEWLSATAMGWLELEKGEQVRNPFGGRQSRIRAGALLRKRMDDLGIHFDDFGRDPDLMGDPIVLRGPKRRGQGRSLPIPAGEPAETYRNEMLLINRWLAGADIVSAEPDKDGRFRDDGDRWLRRIFNNGCLDQGGRLYGGFWQGMSESHRLESISINQEPIVSLDFGQCGIHLAYAHVGAAPPQGDLYLIPGLEEMRDGVKKVMSSIFHRVEPMKKLPRGTRGLFDRRLTVQDVLAAVLDHHKPIGPLFESGYGMTGFFVESQVLVQSLLRLRDLKVVALPVHDCLLVPLSAAGVAKGVMRSAFKEVTGAKVDIQVDGLCGAAVARDPGDSLDQVPWVRVLQEG